MSRRKSSSSRKSTLDDDKLRADLKSIYDKFIKKYFKNKNIKSFPGMNLLPVKNQYKNYEYMINIMRFLFEPIERLYSDLRLITFESGSGFGTFEVTVKKGPDLAYHREVIRNFPKLNAYRVFDHHYEDDYLVLGVDSLNISEDQTRDLKNKLASSDSKLEAMIESREEGKFYDKELTVWRNDRAKIFSNLLLPHFHESKLESLFKTYQEEKKQFDDDLFKILSVVFKAIARNHYFSTQEIHDLKKKEPEYKNKFVLEDQDGKDWEIKFPTEEYYCVKFIKSWKKIFNYFWKKSRKFNDLFSSPDKFEEYINKLSVLVHKSYAGTMFKRLTYEDNLVFAHGDLHPGNIILSHDKESVNFIDWKNARIGSYALDFTILNNPYIDIPVDTKIGLYEIYSRELKNFVPNIVKVVASLESYSELMADVYIASISKDSSVAAEITKYVKQCPEYEESLIGHIRHVVGSMKKLDHVYLENERFLSGKVDKLEKHILKKLSPILEYYEK